MSKQLASCLQWAAQCAVSAHLPVLGSALVLHPLSMRLVQKPHKNSAEQPPTSRSSAVLSSLISSRCASARASRTSASLMNSASPTSCGQEGGQEERHGYAWAWVAATTPHVRRRCRPWAARRPPPVGRGQGKPNWCSVRRESSRHARIFPANDQRASCLLQTRQRTGAARPHSREMPCHCTAPNQSTVLSRRSAAPTRLNNWPHRAALHLIQHQAGDALGCLPVLKRQQQQPAAAVAHLARPLWHGQDESQQ